MIPPCVAEVVMRAGRSVMGQSPEWEYFSRSTSESDDLLKEYFLDIDDVFSLGAYGRGPFDAHECTLELLCNDSYIANVMSLDSTDDKLLVTLSNGDTVIIHIEKEEE